MGLSANYTGGSAWAQWNKQDGTTMTLQEAKALIGKSVEAQYSDRHGNLASNRGLLLEIEYLPMYGSNLIFDFGEVGLDRLVSLGEAADKKAA